MKDIHGYVGAYVTDALDDELRVAFGEHLDECESCSSEVQEFAETLSQLSALATTVPPPELREQVLARIAEVRIDPPVIDDDETSWPPPSALRADVLAKIAATPLEPNELAPLASLSDRRRMPRWLGAAVAASVLLAAMFGGWSVIQRQQIGDLQRALASQQQSIELLQAPDLQTQTITFPDGSRGSYLVSRAQNRALLRGTIKPAPDGRDFQAWTMHGPGPTPRPAGVFHGPQVEVWINDLGDAKALALTEEPEGGVPTPTDAGKAFGVFNI